MWLLTHGKFLSNFNRWRRNLSKRLICEPCQEQEETNLHVIQDCIEAKKVWPHFISLDLQQKFYLLPPQEWVLWNLSSGKLHRLSREWRIRFAVTCWWVWMGRNEAIFNGSCLGEHLKVDHINKSVEETCRRNDSGNY